MPRVSGIYSRPTGIDAVANNTIDSGKYNSNVADVEADLNLPRPIVAGGTGATSADEALTNLSAEKRHQDVPNYNSFIFTEGSFTSSPGIPGAPNPTDSFSGICYKYNDSFVVLEARQINSNTSIPGTVYVREMKSGVWGAWVQDGTSGITGFVKKAGDTMTGPLHIDASWPVAALKLEQGAGTGSETIYADFANTGGSMYVGRESGAGNQLTVGGLPYYGVINVAGDFGIQIGTQNTSRFMIGPTGGVNIGGNQLGQPLNVRVNTNLNFCVSPGLGAVLLQSLNDAHNAFQPLEISASTLRISGTMSQNGNWRSALFIGRSQTFFDAGVSAALELIGTTTGTGGGFIGFVNANNVILGNIGITGAAPGTGVTYNTTSDGRLKEDLRPYNVSGQVLDALKVYDFKWKSTGERDVGVIAQEAIIEFPRAISAMPPGEDGTILLGVDYSKFVPVLIEEVQRLRKRTGLLETKVGVLETKIAALEASSGSAPTILQRLDVLDEFRRKIEAL